MNKALIKRYPWLKELANRGAIVFEDRDEEYRSALRSRTLPEFYSAMRERKSLVVLRFLRDGLRTAREISDASGLPRLNCGELLRWLTRKGEVQELKAKVHFGGMTGRPTSQFVLVKK